MLNNNLVYSPIVKKLLSWIKYEENKPKTEYDKDRNTHDKYRANNDLDCVLRGGDLRADTIFSLWRPLRFSLVHVSGYDKIVNITGMKISPDISFFKSLLVNGNLTKLLPEEAETTKLLSKLFEYGQNIENTMILPYRWMQKRGSEPYHDYMPRFLYECFEGGDFSSAFKSDEELIKWITDEKLNMFFKGDITKENIIDLAGSGDIKNNKPVDINYMLKNYINILKQRQQKMQERC